MTERFFTILHIVKGAKHAKGKEHTGGHFKGTPMAVAKKMASRFCRHTKIKGQCTLFVTLKETTKGSKNKEYTYKIKRVKSTKTIERGGIEITYKYEFKATRM